MLSALKNKGLYRFTDTFEVDHCKYEKGSTILCSVAHTKRALKSQESLLTDFEIHMLCDHLNKKSASWASTSDEAELIFTRLFLIVDEDTQELNFLKTMDCIVLKQELFSKKFLPIIC